MPKKKAEKNGKGTAEEVAALSIPKIAIHKMHIKLIGDSALISHAWSDKAKAMMLGKQMGKAKAKKEPKDPEQDYQDSLYPHPDGGYGFPAVAFKAAAVRASTSTDGVKMTEARAAFHVDCELVPIDGEPTPREDMVRIGMGTADIRYRGEFKKWSVLLPIAYNANALTPEQIVHLFNLAGFGVGVGEWRPQKNGQYGRFHVALEGE